MSRPARTCCWCGSGTTTRCYSSGRGAWRSRSRPLRFGAQGEPLVEQGTPARQPARPLAVELRQDRRVVDGARPELASLGPNLAGQLLHDRAVQPRPATVTTTPAAPAGRAGTVPARRQVLAEAPVGIGAALHLAQPVDDL